VSNIAGISQAGIRDNILGILGKALPLRDTAANEVAVFTTAKGNLNRPPPACNDMLQPQEVKSVPWDCRQWINHPRPAGLPFGGKPCA
jgi:hypothetical protein